MANPSTTHVIEIETGIGEPAFIPLSLGHELQPISVGKKGMWRIESARVLDVHAFVYFDGTSLFLQSADEQNAASVDGFRVGKAWTELHAPCKIEVGMARLRYRSLIADADQPPPPPAPMAAPPPPDYGSQPGGAPSASGGASQPPQRMISQRPPQASSQPVAFPKADRPFKPGEFAAQADDESTRFAPLDATSGGGRGASGAHPRPAAGEEGPSTRPEPPRMATGGVMAVQGTGQFGVMPQGGPGGTAPGVMVAPQNMSQGGSGYPPQPAPQVFASQSYPSLGSGQYAMGSNPQLPGPQGMMQGDPSMSGGYGSMTPQGGLQQPAQPAGGAQDLLAKIKTHATPKLIAGVLFIIAGVVYLFDDDAPRPKKNPTVVVDAGPLASVTGSTAPPATAPPVMPLVATAPVAPAWPAGVPCPPPNWPPNTPLPCTPNNVTVAPPDRPDRPDRPAGGKDAGAGREPKDAGAALPAGTKTLERQAVDFVAAGDNTRAAAAYEELVRRDPNNKVYGEAARILRAKLDGGAP
jgi:hypothetical protein